MRLTRSSDGAVIAERVEVARSLGRRLVGLIGTRDFPAGSALVIPGCGRIHTFLMRFPIDVIFLDAKDCILCVEPNVRPFGITKPCPGARTTIELPAGTIAAYELQVGDEIPLS